MPVAVGDGHSLAHLSGGFDAAMSCGELVGYSIEQPEQSDPDLDDAQS